MDNFTLRVQTIARKNGLTIDEKQLDQLNCYVSLLVDWNTKINLISRVDIQNIWWNHIFHSISILFFANLPAGAKVLDLGTGGGLPGIPLAILRSDLRFALIDSIGKKTKAVEDMVSKLNLSSVEVANGRAEALGILPRFKGGFDIVMSRAVAPLSDLIRWSKPFLKAGTNSNKRPSNISTKENLPAPPFMLSLKGGDLSGEIETAKQQARTLRIESLNLVFEGSEEIGLQDKKLIVVQF
jgi:16S rRNA (guanine527-N7)-methyltransferase